MNIQPLKDYCTAQGVTAISPVRKNTNGYPFVTLLSSKFEGGAMNIYFSKSTAAKVVEGQEPKALGLSSMRVVEASNATGEARLKLTNSTGDYASVEDLF